MVVFVSRTRLIRALVCTAVSAVHTFACVLVAWVSTDLAAVTWHMWKFAEIPSPLLPDRHPAAVALLSTPGLIAALLGLRFWGRWLGARFALLCADLLIFVVTLTLGLLAMYVEISLVLPI
jgi:hypothetical protein